MKINEKAKKETLNALDFWMEEFLIRVQRLRTLAEKVETEEQMMAIKRDMLIFQFSFVPLSNADSYFCNKMEREDFYDCQNCPYGMLHGICVDEGSNSDYIKIKKAQAKLIKEVQNYHRETDDYKAAEKLKNTKGNA